MSSLEVIFVIVIIGGFLSILFFINLKIKTLQNSSNNEKDQRMMLSVLAELRRDIQGFSGESRKEVQLRLDKISDELNRGIVHSSEAIERQFKESQTLIKETAEKITRFEETNKKIADFAGQLQSLESVLKNPKHRGILGEYYLETMLKNVFDPTQYKMQFKFTNGEIVDAVIFYQKKIIPIDSKFSLEDYNKMIEEKDIQRKKVLYRELALSIKKRIEETAKYIRQKEDTYDFAVMFIPSEGVYYDMISTDVGAMKETAVDLIEYAHKKNVVIVSPSSFYAYLQTILHGLRAVEMKESMVGIIKKVEQLDKHLRTYEVYYKKVGDNLNQTVSNYNKSTREFAKIDKDVYRITDGEAGRKGEIDLIEVVKTEAVD